ncbi:isoprenoid biosynthesis glyoxalase ElbB [Colwellia echini]|uniref:Glyoxalase n=1 Tax=Colwellia echini TaxID=1982103 RepID=A0ABY3N0U9_9GAMM|nr:isoprenoid biosynthesis glyoxalase ElbB [Colwellia echini]TYK67113.1 isoprenoid biosynthesis glyoxalase ElbB [Colwellia echini]
MKNIAVILSGCGVYDGSEIQEAVLTLLAIDQQGASYRCFAPNIAQHHVINHLTGEVSAAESRNVLVEAARIGRGDVEDIVELDEKEFDAIIFVGGFGAAKNLSNFALCNIEDNDTFQVNEQVLTAAKSFANVEKPAGFMCIAPAMLPLIYPEGIKGTIGKDNATANLITAKGLTHIDCTVTDIVIDETYKVVTTPAYMLAESISEAAVGINKLVKYVIALCK